MGIALGAEMMKREDVEQMACDLQNTIIRAQFFKNKVNGRFQDGVRTFNACKMELDGRNGIIVVHAGQRSSNRRIKETGRIDVWIDENTIIRWEKDESGELKRSVLSPKQP